MTNEELIDLFRKVERADYPVCSRCPITNACDDAGGRCLFGSAADALEAAEKRIATYQSDVANLEQREKELNDVLNERARLITELQSRIAELEKEWEKAATIATEYAAKCYDMAVKLPKWVSVEDHLPEESGEYSVYIQMGTGVEVPDYLGNGDLSYVTSMYFKKKQMLWFDEYDEPYNADLSLVDTVNNYHVTHWMPLPKPPKGEHE